MKLICVISLLLFGSINANRLLQQTTCAQVRCGPGACFDHPVDGATCCPETMTCFVADFALDEEVECGGVTYPNRCFAECFDTTCETCDKECFDDPCNTMSCPAYPDTPCFGNCCYSKFVEKDGLGGYIDVTDECETPTPTSPPECATIRCSQGTECGICDDGEVGCCDIEPTLPPECALMLCIEGTECGVCDDGEVGCCSPESCICPAIHEPYCCNDKTYGNSCKAACDDFDVETDCTFGACSPTFCICTQEYEPVCCEGNQYGNACGAACSGYDALTECELRECGTYVTCERHNDCEKDNGFRCKPEPECFVSSSDTDSCSTVCVDIKKGPGGICQTFEDCDKGYECIYSPLKGKGRCVKYQQPQN